MSLDILKVKSLTVTKITNSATHITELHEMGSSTKYYIGPFLYGYGFSL